MSDILYLLFPRLEGVNFVLILAGVLGIFALSLWLGSLFKKLWLRAQSRGVRALFLALFYLCCYQAATVLSLFVLFPVFHLFRALDLPILSAFVLGLVCYNFTATFLTIVLSKNL